MSRMLCLAGMACSVLTAVCVVWAAVGGADAQPLKFMLSALIAVCGLSFTLVGQCWGRVEALEARLSGAAPEPATGGSASMPPRAPALGPVQAAAIALLGVMSMLTTVNVAMLASRRPAVPPVVPAPIVVAPRPTTQQQPAGAKGAEWWKSIYPQEGR
jgi:hypothetical protein